MVPADQPAEVFVARHGDRGEAAVNAALIVVQAIPSDQPADIVVANHRAGGVAGLPGRRDHHTRTVPDHAVVPAGQCAHLIIAGDVDSLQTKVADEGARRIRVAEQTDIIGGTPGDEQTWEMAWPLPSKVAAN